MLVVESRLHQFVIANQFVNLCCSSLESFLMMEQKYSHYLIMFVNQFCQSFCSAGNSAILTCLGVFGNTLLNLEPTEINLLLITKGVETLSYVLPQIQNDKSAENVLEHILTFIGY